MNLLAAIQHCNYTLLTSVPVCNSRLEINRAVDFVRRFVSSPALAPDATIIELSSRFSPASSKRLRDKKRPML
jgi:hypothetical protein